MEHVGGRVVAPDAIAPLGVDPRDHFVALDDFALRDLAVVEDQVGEPVLGIADGEHGAGCRREGAGVADLATALRVERRAVEYDVDGSRTGRRGAFAADDESAHDGSLRDVLLPAGELGRADLLEQLAVKVDGDVAVPARSAVRLLRACALARHPLAEAVEVDRTSAFVGDLAREV